MNRSTKSTDNTPTTRLLEYPPTRQYKADYVTRPTLFSLPFNAPLSICNLKCSRSLTLSHCRISISISPRGCVLRTQRVFCASRRRRCSGCEHTGLVASGCTDYLSHLFVKCSPGLYILLAACICWEGACGGFGGMEERKIYRAARIVSNAQCELDHDEWLFL